MPRAAAVTVDEAVAVIVQFGLHFQSEQLPIWSSEIWTEMSLTLSGKWTRDCVYTNVTKNRRSILSLAWKKMNLPFLKTPDLNNNSTLEETTLSKADSSNSREDSLDEYNVHKNNPGAETFHLILTEQEWTQIKPDSDSSCEKQERVKLACGVWTNVVAYAMWLQFRMPCAFVFKRADVSLSADEQIYSISIDGKCKSKKCGNIFEGTAVKIVSKLGLTIEVRTRDTRGTAHDVVKRPLNGQRRKEAQKEIRAEGCAVWKKRQARKLMRPGDVEPPILPNDDVIRQTCKEGVDAELDVDKSDGRDLIRAIEEIGLKPEYCGVIHSTASRPFHVFYRAPAQLHAYKEYCRLYRDSCFICVDATGSIVKPLERLDGTKSGHIFLYSIVINFDKTTIAVNQMLSEQHDTEFIEFWLKRWIRAGAPKPKEAVCDYSRALLSALCLAFNDQTIKTYVSSCFSTISESNVGSSQKPATRLSVDVAHLIHLVCRWKCFKSLSHTSVKEFFVRCVALLVDCISFIDFEDIFSLICAVGMQKHEDARLAIPQAETTKEARKKLEHKIATWGIQVDFDIENPKNKLATERPESFALNDLNEPNSGSETDINKWIDQRVSRATVSLTTGEDLNPFYVPDFVNNLSKLCREFPLWTRVGRKDSKERATSSYVESYFNYLKTQVFRNMKRPIRVDKFLKLHARDITGATLLGSAKLLQSNAERYTNASDEPQIAEEVSKVIETLSAPQELADPDLMSSENWRQKAKPLSPVDSDSTPINWKIDSELLSNGSQLVEAPYSTGVNSVPTVENSAELDLNENFLCSTPLGDKSDNNEIMLLALADHSYSKVEDITGLKNITDHTCFDNPSTLLNGNLALDQPHKISTEIQNFNFEALANDSYTEVEEIMQLENVTNSARSENPSPLNSNRALDQPHRSSTEISNSDFKSSTDTRENPPGNMLTDNLGVYVADEPEACTKIAQELQPKILPTERCQIVKRSKYFRPYPEVSHMNSHLSNNKRAVLLANGLLCREVKVNGEAFFVHRTCSLDSFVQILLTAAIDYDQYFTFIQNSTNSIFQLVLQLIQKGVTQRIYLERMLILKPFCPVTVAISTDNRIISHTIDAEFSIAHLVEKVMRSEPSINNREECSHCDRRTYPSPLLAPNHRTIGRLGFSGLQAALDFRSPIYNIRCRDPCTGKYTLFRELNNHVYIELDIRPDLQATSGTKCKLKQMPVTLHLAQTAEITYEYRLVGIVAHMPGHYIAYSLRKNGWWEIYNDLRKDVETCKSDTEIEPHLAVYVRMNTLS